MTSIALALLWSIIGTGLVENGVLRLGPVIASIVLVLGVAAWDVVIPAVYGATVFISLTLAGIVLVFLYRAGNLVGLFFYLFAGAGAILGAIAAIGGRVARLLNLPRWFAPSAVTTAIVAMVGIAGWAAWVRSQQDVTVLERIQDIRRAELEYAQRQTDRTFTCDGPRLPGLTGIEWRSNTQLGTSEKNEARLEGHQVYLRCEASARPQWVDIQVVSSAGLNANIHVGR